MKVRESGSWLSVHGVARHCDITHAGPAIARHDNQSGRYPRLRRGWRLLTWNRQLSAKSGHRVPTDSGANQGVLSPKAAGLFTIRLSAQSSYALFNNAGADAVVQSMIEVP